MEIKVKPEAAHAPLPETNFRMLIQPLDLAINSHNGNGLGNVLCVRVAGENGNETAAGPLFPNNNNNKQNKNTKYSYKTR